MRRSSSVAVTGLGIVSPLGSDPDSFLEGLLECRSCLRPLSLFDSGFAAAPTVAEIRDPLPKRRIPGFRLSRTDAIGVSAARSAARQISTDCADFRESGVVMASTVGGLSEIVPSLVSDPRNHYRNGGFGQVTSYQTSQVAECIGADLGLRGPRLGVSAACASGAMAVALGARMINAEMAPMVLAGGSESLCEFTLSGFNALQALAHGPCKPFDRNRKGLNLGEGAAVLVLESLERARARHATVWAVLKGWSMTNDAYHPTAPHKEGLGLAESMMEAMKMAEVDPERIDYVNAHGTGTVLNDDAEVKAMESAFGSRSRPVAVSSSKSYFGHCLGASGALEAAVTILSLRFGFLPPTLRLEDPIESATVDWVAGPPRKGSPSLAISVSAGFGGSNTSLVFGAGEADPT